MRTEQEIEAYLAKLRKERPKAKSYKTFTSRRKESHVSFQKPRYEAEHKNTAPKMVDEHIKLVIQAGNEFDAWTACLGSADGKVKPTPALAKLVTKGFKRNGEIVYLDPKDLHRRLEELKGSQNNRVIYWEERDRPEQEKRLEQAIEEREAKIESRDMQIGKLVGMLRGKVKQEEIEEILKGA